MLPNNTCDFQTFQTIGKIRVVSHSFTANWKWVQNRQFTILQWTLICIPKHSLFVVWLFINEFRKFFSWSQVGNQNAVLRNQTKTQKEWQKWQFCLKLCFAKQSFKQLTLLSLVLTRKLGKVRSHIKFRSRSSYFWHNCPSNEWGTDKTTQKLKDFSKRLVYGQEDCLQRQ